MKTKIPLDQYLTEKEYKKKESRVDKLSSISYSLVVGSILDLASGLKVVGWLTSRGQATITNYITGGWYGKWRNFLFEKTNTTTESSWVKKRGVDFVAFNTVQTPIYGTAVTIASIVEQAIPVVTQYGFNALTNDNSIDFNQALDSGLKGMTFLATISPLAEPTMNYTMNKFRQYFGLKKPEEQVTK
jgi:hypothetical protein